MLGSFLGSDSQQRQTALRHQIESLESRVVPAVYTVTNLNNAGTGSLRDAITQANAATGTDQIFFTAGLTGTISLRSELLISDSVIIVGPGIVSLTLDGGGFNRCFAISDSKATKISVQISGMALTNGSPGTSTTNNSNDGGLIYNNENLLLDLVDLSTGTFASRGGAVFADTGSQVDITRSSIHDNTASEGGAIYSLRATVNVDASSIFTNVGFDNGGGIFYLGGKGSLTSSTFYGNSCDTDGAAIFAITAANLYLRSCTIVGNTSDANNGGAGVGALTTAPEGGGSNNGTAALVNCLIANNFNSTHQFDPDIYGVFNAASVNNYVSSSNTGGFNGLVNGVNGNVLNVFTYTDPGLSAFQDNGGSTQTILPAPGSLIINMGYNAVPDLIDQRGFNRKVGIVDIGATEYAAIQILPTPVNNLTATPTPTTPVVTLPVNPRERYAVAAASQSGEVKVYDGSNTLIFDLFPYGLTFAGGVHVATADVNGDGVQDIITVPANGFAHVKVYDGRTSNLIQSFFGLPTAFRGGANVAAGDFNGDGKADIAVSVAANGPPLVQVFDGATDKAVNIFYAYFSRFNGGVNLAFADINGDGKADVITTPGIGGGPQVKAFDPATGTLLLSFMAGPAGFYGGLNVAAGDVNGDGVNDIIVGYASGPPIVQAYSATGTLYGAIRAFDAFYNTGVAVATVDTTGSGVYQILATSGKNFGGGALRRFDLVGTRIQQIIPFDEGFLGGAYVG